MAFLNQQIFNVNIDQNIIANPQGVGASSDQVPIVTLTQKNIVFVIDLLLDGGGLAAALIEATDTFSFAADRDFAKATANLLVSTNSEFNITGDRADLNPEGGKISVRVDADTLGLETALGDEQEIQLFGEIQIFAAAATNPKVIFTFPMTARNVVDNSTTPAPPISSFYTKAEVDALLGGKEDLRIQSVVGVDATVGAVSDIHTVTALHKRWVQEYAIETTAITGAAVMPTIRIKTDSGAILAGPQIMLVAEGVVGGIMRFQSNHNRILAATEKTQVEVTIPGTSTTHVFTAYDDGIEVDV